MSGKESGRKKEPYVMNNATYTHRERETPYIPNLITPPTHPHTHAHRSGRKKAEEERE